ncbi:MAG TPA: KpsF/GutQ family sugar-phosphate isomerase, partial [Phycisphaerae bacterium]|nr:KpsF/GutQ family sugar-phosphate isomerase [Phycisphaerae bacterium]
AISALADQLGEQYTAAVQAIYGCEGQVIMTGLGKAGIVGTKISATFASTGTPSIPLHPVEALHGDLGRVHRDDVAIALSHSGETEEMIVLADHIKGRGATIVTITGNEKSSLAGASDIVICYGRVEEACPLGLAPSVSTSCMLALGDALAMTVMDMRDFTPEDYAVFHPGGALGRKLLKVEDTMSFHKGPEWLILASQDESLGEALDRAEKSGRRTGAMLFVDPAGCLSGILTDADLRRVFINRRGQDVLAMPANELMTNDPKHIHTGELASEALAILNQFRIDELPVVDDQHRPVGIIDVQDLVGLKTVNHAKN